MNTHAFVRSLGNAPFIGKSSVFVEVPGETSFILDCGQSGDHGQHLTIQKEFNHDSRVVSPAAAQFCVVTHSHADHSAAWEQLGRIPIFSTAITRVLVSEKFIAVNYYEHVYPLPRKDIYFVLTPAGHAPGAAIVTVVTPSLRLVYTGDW